MFSDQFFDSRRRQFDAVLNQRYVSVVKPGKNRSLKLVHQSRLNVGEVIRLSRMEEVPADMILFSTSMPNGVAKINVRSLTGDSASVSKQAVRKTRDVIQLNLVSKIKGLLTFESSVSDVNIMKTSNHMFTGRLHLKGHPRPSNLNTNNFIPAGSVIVSPDWIYGVVVHTRCNRPCERRGRGPNRLFTSNHIRSRENLAVLALFILATVVSSTLLLGCWEAWSVARIKEDAPSLFGKLLYDNEMDVVLTATYTLFLLWSLWCPYVQIGSSVAAVVYSLTLEADPTLKNLGDVDDVETRQRCIVKTVTNLPDLCVSDIVFASKCGTLTKSQKLTFRACSVAGWVYGDIFSNQFIDDENDMEISTTRDVRFQMSSQLPSESRTAGEVSELEHESGTDDADITSWLTHKDSCLLESCESDCSYPDNADVDITSWTSDFSGPMSLRSVDDSDARDSPAAIPRPAMIPYSRTRRSSLWSISSLQGNQATRASPAAGDEDPNPPEPTTENWPPRPERRASLSVFSCLDFESSDESLDSCPAVTLHTVSDVCQFRDPDFYMHWRTGTAWRRNKIDEFVFAMAVCNDCRPYVELAGVSAAVRKAVDDASRWRTRIRTESHNLNAIRYLAPSREEESMVMTASFFGLTLVSRSPTHLTLCHEGEMTNYSVIASFPYTPKRQRGAICVQRKGEMGATLFVRGHPAQLAERLCTSHDSKEHMIYSISPHVSALSRLLSYVCSILLEQLLRDVVQ